MSGAAKIDTAEGAQHAIEAIDAKACKRTSMQQAKLGAQQNVMQHRINAKSQPKIALPKPNSRVQDKPCGNVFD